MVQQVQPPQSAVWPTGQPATQAVYHFHYSTPTSTNQPPTKEQATQQMYNAVFHAINQVGNFQPSTATQQISTKKEKPKTKYYKPAATEVSVLSVFFISTLIFIAGIEFMLRRSLPVARSLYTPTDTITPSNITNATNSTMSFNSTVARNGTDSGKAIIEGSANLFQFKSSPTCIGVERIISVAEVTLCGTATTTAEPCRRTTTQHTFEKPIYDVAISTMPCYICAMQSQGIEIADWMTATTTHNAVLSSNRAATIYPCSTCEGITLTKAAPWETTVTGLARPYTTYTTARHEH